MKRTGELHSLLPHDVDHSPQPSPCADQIRRIVSRFTGVFLLSLTVCGTSRIQAQTANAVPWRAFFHISMSHEFSHLVSGRLLLFVAPKSDHAKDADIDMMAPTNVYVVAKEIHSLEHCQ